MSLLERGCPKCAALYRFRFLYLKHMTGNVLFRKGALGLQFLGSVLVNVTSKHCLLICQICHIGIYDV